MFFLKEQNKFIGVHINDLYFFDKIVLYAKSLNAKSLSFFLGNPVSWKHIKISSNLIDNFNYVCRKFLMNKNYIVPHSSFLINLGHFDKVKLYRSRKLLIHEINLCLLLGLKYINFHPGNYLNVFSLKKCLRKISDSINYIINETKDIILLIENTAGQGTSVGYTFEQISEIIYFVENKSRIGVCLDTCHMFVSGYDLRSFEMCEKVFLNFNNVIGLFYLKCIHLNGSKYGFLSKKDRHSELLNSNLQNNLFYWIMKNNLFNNMPIILETTNVYLWRKEINWLNSL